VLVLCLSSGCYLFRSTADYSESCEYGPKQYKDVAIVVEAPGRPVHDYSMEAHTISVERVFERALMQREYNIVARNDAIQKILDEQNIQLRDLTTEQGVIVGDLANAQALMIVHIIEFDCSPMNDGRYQNTVCVAAKLCDLKDGRTLWVGDLTLKDDCGTNRPDIELLNRAANDVAITCSPRPWYWVLCH
jgi:hypothetical protein